MIHHPIQAEVKVAGTCYEVGYDPSGHGDLKIYVPGSEEFEAGYPTWVIPQGSLVLEKIIVRECATAEPEYDPDDESGYSYSLGIDDSLLKEEVSERIEDFVQDYFHKKIPAPSGRVVQMFHDLNNNQAA